MDASLPPSILQMNEAILLQAKQYTCVMEYLIHKLPRPLHRYTFPKYFLDCKIRKYIFARFPR